MSNNDPNLGFVGGVNGFEEWACDDFNLLEYVGQDNSPFENNRDVDDFEVNDEDESMRKKDMIYSTLQYNNALLGYDQSGKLADAYKVYKDFTDCYLDHFSDVPFCYDQTSGIPSAVTDDDFIVKDDPSIPSTSKTTALPTHKLKVELDPPSEMYDDITSTYTINSTATRDNCYTPSSYTSSSSLKQIDDTFTSKNKPRKYRIKAEYEKRNPQYKAKREKNNDAVRRSRDKAKKVQEEKEDRLNFLESESVRQSKVIAQLRQRNEFLENQLISMKRSCTCRTR